MKILFLDDDETRHSFFAEWTKAHDVTHVRTASKAADLLEEQKWDACFLDHDLGESEALHGNGTSLARWLHENPLKIPPMVVIHSWNSDGAKTMMDYIWGSSNRDVYWNPFGPGLRRFLI